MKQTFRAEDRAEWSREVGRPESLSACRHTISLRIERYQSQDTRYWSRIISDLRLQYRAATLVPRGTPVAELVRP
jgi:hypothetical protein